MYPPNMPAPMTTTSNGSPPLLLNSDQVLHTQRPRKSWENAVCCTSTRFTGSGLRRGSMEPSYSQFCSFEPTLLPIGRCWSCETPPRPLRIATLLIIVIDQQASGYDVNSNLTRFAVLRARGFKISALVHYLNVRPPF